MSVPYIIDIDGEYAALSHCPTCGQWLTRFCDLCESAHDVARQFPNGPGSVASDPFFHASEIARDS